MKVYVVIGYITHEGYQEPDAIFDTKEQAEEHCKSGWRFSKPEIFEMELDTTPQTKLLSDELTVDDYKECLDDVNRLTKELDIALNGDGAAEQASLCDIVCQVKSSKWKLVQTKPLLSDEEIAEIINRFDLNDGDDSPFYPLARAIEERILGK